MPRRILQGRVVSDKMQKSITVLVERQVEHPVYKKYVKQSKKFTAHVDGEKPAVGTVVEIIESAPISKTKRWRLVSEVQAAAAAAGDSGA